MALGIGFFMVVVVPLTAIFLHHQRKMAEFFQRSNDQQGQQGQINRLEAEVGALKERINHLILQSDDRKNLQERVGLPRLPLS